MSSGFKIKLNAFYSGEVVQSDIRNMTEQCRKAGGINLSQGICDLDMPDILRLELDKAVAAGLNQYTSYEGFPQLRAEIAQKCREFNKIKCDPDRNVVVSAGSTGAFYNTCRALFDKGDEVIVFEPYYGYHLSILASAGVVVKLASLKLPDWSFDMAELESLAGPKTKAIIINTPVNPCGKVFTGAELAQIAALCVKKDLLVITDEIYEHITYDGHRHISPATLPELADRTITISGFSKTFCITGWRVGYCIAPADIARTIGHINDLVYICAPTPLQAAIAGAMQKLPPSYYESLQKICFSKRQQLCAALADAGLAPIVPQGAYYVLADIEKIPGGTAREKTMRLLKDTGVAAVPGTAFYRKGRGENLARFCFAKKDRDLDEACNRLLKLK